GCPSPYGQITHESPLDAMRQPVQEQANLVSLDRKPVVRSLNVICRRGAPNFPREFCPIFRSTDMLNYRIGIEDIERIVCKLQLSCISRLPVEAAFNSILHAEVEKGHLRSRRQQFPIEPGPSDIENSRTFGNRKHLLERKHAFLPEQADHSIEQLVK